MEREPARDEEKRTLPDFVGRFASGKPEDHVAERADEILRKELPDYLLAERDD